MKLASLCAATALSFSLAAHAAPGFTDATMNPASYTSVIFNTDPSVSIAVATLAAGNPGSALQLHYTNSGAAVNSESFVGLLYTGFSYDPSTQGALASLDYANDRYVDFGSTINATLNTVTRALILQGGHYYIASLADVQLRKTWFTTSATGLLGSQFNGFDFATGVGDSSHPDFSGAGGAMQFGFTSRFQLNSAGQPFALDGFYGYDNVSYSLNATAVPEPRTWALLLVGFGAVGTWARRRRLNAAD